MWANEPTHTLGHQVTKHATKTEKNEELLDSIFDPFHEFDTDGKENEPVT